MKKIFPYFLMAAAFAGALGAQTSTDSLLNFSFFYFTNGTPISTGVSPNGFISFPDTNVGKSTGITFGATSSSRLNYTLTNAAVTGNGFALKSTATTIPPGGTGEISLTFTPTASTPQPNLGTLQFQLVSETNVTFNVFFNLFGNPLQPQLVISYIDPATGNQLPLNPGGVIQFGKATVGQTATTQVIVVNNGTGNGTVDSVAVSGSAYKLTGEPLVPAIVAAGKTFATGVSYSPTGIGDDTGTLTLSVSGVSSTYILDGQGASAVFSYSVLTVGGSAPVLPNGTITLPDTPADGTSKNSVILEVKNTGNLPGTISSILALGTDFQLANLPVLPYTLKPGDIAVFGVVFMPVRAGTSAGRLQVGSDLFNLAGNALGSSLTLSVDVGLGPAPVASQAIISLPNTVVGDKRLVYVNVTNKGNQAAVVSGIGVSGTGFTIPSLPSIPATLAPGQTIQFQVQYAPATVSTVTGTVTINDLSLTLLGVGQAPPPLPAVTFTNVPGTLGALQQPSAGLQLAAAYPYDLKGTLTLAFLSDSFVDDPAIQFATGARTIGFTFPANTTQAVFTQASGAVLGTLAPFQTGTVSGTVTLSAAGFMVGQTDITPGAAPSKTYSIPGGAPQLRSVRLDSTTGAQIVLLISGYSTPRNLSQLAFQLTGAQGSSLQTTNLTLDVSGAFTSWYSSSASNVFGSQFTVAVTLTVTGDPAAIQSISVTATNTKGTSGPQTVSLR